MVGQGLQRQHAGQVLRQQVKGDALAELAHGVHLALGVAAVPVHQRVQLVAQRGPVRRGVKHAGVEQFVQQHRVARQVLRCPRAGAHSLATRCKVAGYSTSSAR